MVDIFVNGVIERDPIVCLKVYHVEDVDHNILCHKLINMLNFIDDQSKDANKNNKNL